MGYRSTFQDKYEESIRLLSHACLLKYREATQQDFFDALSIAIGKAANPKYLTIAYVAKIIEQSAWPREQIEADIFIGRYVREYALLAERGRNRGLQGIDLSEIETIDTLFPPVTQADLDRIRESRRITKISLQRIPCIPLLDEAGSGRSALFESVRIIMAENDPGKTVAYLSSYVATMAKEKEPDVLIGRRLKTALMLSRKTTTKRNENS